MKCRRRQRATSQREQRIDQQGGQRGADEQPAHAFDAALHAQRVARRPQQHQRGKHAEAKNKAKNFIDTVVYVAVDDAISVWVKRGLDTGRRAPGAGDAERIAGIALAWPHSPAACWVAGTCQKEA